MKRFLLAASVALLAVACGAPPSAEDPTLEDASPSPRTGAVAGRVCNTHVGQWVVGDVIVPLEDGDVRQGRTAHDGTFELDAVPVGQRAVYVIGDGFERSFAVQIIEHETASIGSDECG